MLIIASVPDLLETSNAAVLIYPPVLSSLHDLSCSNGDAGHFLFQSEALLILTLDGNSNSQSNNLVKQSECPDNMNTNYHLETTTRITIF